MRNNRPRRQENIVRINEKISAAEVRVIDDEGTMVGVVPIGQAIEMANDRELDLVEISPGATPPVCKLIDYGKYVYQAEKKRKEAKKNQKVVHLKEIKMRPKTDVHDYNFKIKHAKQFIEHGDRVKITIRFKGREMAYIENGREKLNMVVEELSEIAKMDGTPRMEGRNLSVTLQPIKPAK